MAGYWIKGIDDKPYFAENEQVVIQWIQEHRIAPFTEIRQGEASDFRPADSYPEFNQAFRSPSGAFSSEALLQPHPIELQSSIRTGLALKEGWRLFSSNLLLSYGALLVWFLIWVAIGLVPILFEGVLGGVLGNPSSVKTGSQFLSYFIQMILAGPLMVGFYKFWLNMVDQENPHLRDLFNGFEVWWQAMLSQWIKTFIVFIIVMLSIPFFSLSLFSKFENLLQNGQVPVVEEWWGFFMGIVLVVLIAATVLSLFWYVEFFLADRCSLKLSRCFMASGRLALRNIGGISVLFITVGFLLLTGALFFFVGALIIAPWLILTVMHSYRQLVPRGTKL